MYKIVFLRHGESTWKHGETGSSAGPDVDLSREPSGGHEAGRTLKNEGYDFDWPSPPSSAGYRTSGSPSTRWTGCGSRGPLLTLNERHYGLWQGLKQGRDGQEFGETRSRSGAGPMTSPSTRWRPSDERWPGMIPAIGVDRGPSADRMPQRHRGTGPPLRHDAIVPAIRDAKRCWSPPTATPAGHGQVSGYHLRPEIVGLNISHPASRCLRTGAGSNNRSSHITGRPGSGERHARPWPLRQSQ